MDNLWMQCIGNLGRGVELKYTDGGKLFAKVSIGIEVGWGDNKGTEWATATVWGDKDAQRFHDFCQKGTRVYLSGTARTNSWVSKDGEAKSELNLTVKEFRVITKGKQKGDSEATPFDENTSE